MAPTRGSTAVAGTLSLFLTFAGCAGAKTTTELPPIPSAKADGWIETQGLRKWYLKSDGFFSKHETLEVGLVTARPLGDLYAWLDGRYVGANRESSASDAGVGVRSVSVDLTKLAPGRHRLVVADSRSFSRVVDHEFFVSFPMYVIVSNDWDTSDNEDEEFVRQELLRANHPELVLTHFVGPYTFTDPQVSESRREWIAQWLAVQRDQFGDEIGLHIHPYCNFVETAGVTCRTEPVYAENWGRPDGYTVMVSAYTEVEFTKVLRRADELFVQWGLGKPLTFRAGGWSAEQNTLRSLANAGYVADTSAVNWSRIDEWADHQSAALYPWLKEHWSTIHTTSQPYYPSEANILDDAPPTLPVLEVPDNGALVDYVTADEMVEMFHDNWPVGSTLPSSTQYSIGYHPPSYTPEFHQRMDDALRHIDKYLVSADTGPVVYARLVDMADVNWPRD